MTRRNYIAYFLPLVIVGLTAGGTVYHLLNTEEKEYVEERVTVQNEVKVTKRVPTSDEDWGKVDCPLEGLSIDHMNLYNYLSEPTINCTFKISVGGKFHKNYFDGQKWICIDRKYKIKTNSCIVLSFGISSDWSFDDEIDSVFGCKVYAFDPTIGQRDHNRSKNIMFYNLGISDRPGFMRSGKVDSYSNILKLLNLENAIIDYLKMDVEGSEFKFFSDVISNTPNLLKNVKQIGMEVHLPGHQGAAWQHFQRLDCLGFKLMFYGYNPISPVRKVNGRERTTLYEVVWGREAAW
ncbi:hypothetical protein SK128_005404 [Halocaridina rubra]|uniref:Methyltransferase domain-containing protein n=1 Tax=Halocaridina rubra TaxID=373956 RepID=A0AAN8XMU5_HALRR